MGPCRIQRRGLRLWDEQEALSRRGRHETENARSSPPRRRFTGRFSIVLLSAPLQAQVCRGRRRVASPPPSFSTNLPRFRSEPPLFLSLPLSPLFFYLVAPSLSPSSSSGLESTEHTRRCQNGGRQKARRACNGADGGEKRAEKRGLETSEIRYQV